MSVWNQRGQHTAEFALLIGLAAVAAVSMQLILRRAIQAGVQRATDIVLPPSTTSADHTLKELLVTTHNAVDETGTADFHRTVTSQATIVGHSVNEDVRLQPK